MSITEILENVIKQVTIRLDEVKTADDATDEEFTKDRIKRSYYGGYIDGLMRAEMEIRTKQRVWTKKESHPEYYLDNR